jgi:hypothetical protein
MSKLQFEQEKQLATQIIKDLKANIDESKRDEFRVVGENKKIILNKYKDYVQSLNGCSVTLNEVSCLLEAIIASFSVEEISKDDKIQFLVYYLSLFVDILNNK